MEIQIAIVVASGSAIYLWLTLVGGPIAGAVAVTRRSLHGPGWPPAVPIAIGSTMLITAVGAATLSLAMPAAPSISQLVLDGPELLLGLQIGGVLWVLRSAAFGIPRLTPDHEAAIALAPILFTGIDPAARVRLEQQYRRHMIRVHMTRRYTNDQFSPA